MFNGGVRGKRAKDGVGFLSTAEQFNQKSFLVPTVTSFSVTDVSYVPLDNTAVDTAGGETIVINGSGFASGATVQVGATTIGSVTFIDQNRLAFTAPALSSGSYTIYVTNSNGGTGILLSGLVYSGLPTYSTTAGSLGTVYETANINTAVVATGDAPITYSVISGALPAGATLNSNGTITGNAPVDGSSTTYSFTIQASDAQLQESTRAFALTINTDVLTLGFANNTVYSLDGDTAMSNVTLSATSSANSNSAVTFAANTLPTGVSLSGNTIFGTPTTEQTVYSTLTATATQTGRTATRFVSWSVSLGDPYWKNVSLLLTGNSPVNTFVTDASTNNFAVSIVGDTKPNNFNPNTPGYYSNYFDNTGDYLSAPANTALAMGSGAFTMEAWVYNVGGFATDAILECRIDYTSAGGYAFLITSSGYLNVYTQAAFVGQSSTALVSGTWYHVALVRTGTGSNQTTYYINGVASGTITLSGNFTDASTVVTTIGGTPGGENVSGYISNLRIVKGTAVYTSTFTPSTTPLTAISGTSLLTCQSNRFIDTSTNAFAITRNGDVAVRQNHPFTPDPTASTYGSAFFDGTGDYLTTPASATCSFGTSSLTLEGWFYLTSASSEKQLFRNGLTWPTNVWTLVYNHSFAANKLCVIAGNYSQSTYLIASANSLTLNTWNHIAVVRNVNSWQIYINGVADGSSVTWSGSVDGGSSSSLFGVGGDSTSASGLTWIGYISNFRAVNGTAVYTGTFTPPTAPLTAITNTSLLTLQTNQAINNNLFIDDSTNNFAVTRVGNTTQGTFTPYGSNWSNYFDGTGDYLELAYNAALNLSSGNFTIEAWVNPSALGGNYRPIIGITNSNIITASDLQVFLFLGADSRINFRGYTIAAEVSLLSSSTLPLNSWTHIAVVRSGNTFTLYVDGASVASATYSSTFNNNVAHVTRIGRYSEGGTTYHWNGYISNARIVKGTAVYTAAFTPPTTPLTAITNTSLLTCADNRFIDKSTNNFAITKNGDVSVQRFSPFSPTAAYSAATIGGSAYFDGTSDFLTASAGSGTLASGNFTVEGWIYCTANPSGFSTIFSNYSLSGTTAFAIFSSFGSNDRITLYVGGSTVVVGSTTIVYNSWTHIAAVRNSGVTTLYINGVSQGTVSYSGSSSGDGIARIGCAGDNPTGTNFQGYISNSRWVIGTAIYTANFTPSTTPLTAISGTSLLTNFTNAGIYNATMINNLETVGDAKISTTQSKFGGSSMSFDGTGDYLASPDNLTLGFGSGAFTVEGWVYLNNTSGTKGIMFGRGSNSFGLRIGQSYLGNVNGLNIAKSGVADLDYCAFTFVTNTWYHIAVVRSGTTIYFFVNGTQQTTQGSGGGSFSFVNPTTGYYIGCNNDTNEQFNGYIDDLRITKGYARYTSNFSVPITAFKIK